MKKVIVSTLTVLGIAFVACFGIGIADNVKALFGMSADALAGDSFVSRREMNMAPAPVVAAAPMPEEEMKEAAPKADSAKKSMLGLLGTGKGGGGYGSGIGGIGTRGRGGPPAPPAEKDEDRALDTLVGDAEGGAAGFGEAAPTTRAWFPETFLFEPLVVTDAQGRANVPVKVPDRLTTWRVLALAHSREGSQAGAVSSFLGTLPTYVEPVTPPFLYAGDVVKLPVQVVNTTERELTAGLAMTATGASLSSAGGAVKVPAASSALQYVTLTTSRPGEASFKATLSGTDAVEKRIELKPMGRREVITKAGTLAAPRTFTLTGPANPLPGTESLRVRVYPGALGLVRNELSAAPGRGGVAEDAYLLQLLGQAPVLLRSLGATPDAPVIRDLSILATQRVMQHARSPSVDSATLLTEAAFAHPENPVLQRLGERLALQVSMAQRADGTCQGANGWTLQRLLVTTAECVRATQAANQNPQSIQRATAVKLKASGAFERNMARVADGYTAAAILASGALNGGGVDGYRKLVLDGITDGVDGSKYLRVESGVVRADGVTPSTYEATALAILALDGVKDAPIADLGSYLLSGYSPYVGWGDGRANLVALRAAVKLFKDPVPAGVKITIERDGKPMASGSFDANALQDVLTVDADAEGSNGAHDWTIRAEPAVPGLGYSLQLVSYATWKDEPGGGLELTTELPKSIKVGLPAEVKLTAAAPGGIPLKVAFALPAGVQADSTALTALVSNGSITRYETEDGLVTLHVPPQANGALWQKNITVIATLGGTLHSGASLLGTEGSPVREKEFAPVTWKIE
ncbi:MAG: alpha-2-macroglobulin family protein [Archangium sp.]